MTQTLFIQPAIIKAMKISLSTTLLAILLFSLSGCGPKSELEKLRGEREALLSSQKDHESKIEALKIQLETIDQRIAELDTTAPREIKRATVSIEEVSPQTFRHYVRIQGQIESENNVMVSPKMGGVVTQVYVKEGQKVSAGTLLAKTDDGVLLKSMAEIQTQLDLATLAFQKQEKLWNQKIGSEMQYQQAKTQKEALTNSLATLQEQQKMTRITAPISGTVDQVFCKVGEAVSPGFPAFRVMNLNDLKFQSNISETYITRVKKGDVVEINFPAIGEKIETKISMVGQTIHPTNRTVPLEATFKEKSALIKANMIGEISINDATEENAIAISQNLIQKTELGTFVMIAEQNETGEWVSRRRQIQTGLESGQEVVINSGLKVGDKLITLGYQGLSEGSVIKF